MLRVHLIPLMLIGKLNLIRSLLSKPPMTKRRVCQMKPENNGSLTTLLQPCGVHLNHQTVPVMELKVLKRSSERPTRHWTKPTTVFKQPRKPSAKTKIHKLSMTSSKAWKMPRLLLKTRKSRLLDWISTITYSIWNSMPSTKPETKYFKTELRLMLPLLLENSIYWRMSSRVLKNRRKNGMILIQDLEQKELKWTQPLPKLLKEKRMLRMERSLPIKTPSKESLTDTTKLSKPEMIRLALLMKLQESEKKLSTMPWSKREIVLSTISKDLRWTKKVN